MIKLNGIYFILLLCFAQPAFAQEPNKHTIPFILTAYNNIAVKAILNKQDTVQLMFHTAASGITLTETSVQKLKTLKFKGSIDGIKSWGGQENSSRLSENNMLQIGDLTWSNLTIAENKNSGQETDGKFGTDFFKDKIVAIDFDKKLITLYNDLPTEARKQERLKLIIEHDNLFVVANSVINGKAYENKFLLHSGYAGGILYDDEFAKENNLSSQLKVVSEKALKDSFGNILKTKNAILPILKIGNLQLTNVPVGFFEGAIGRQKMSIMGGDILKRFNMIIDQKNADIYLIPSHITI